jgi:hypothetical protein
MVRTLPVQTFATETIDTLVVGAGAVGSVFGHHLASGGARVGYLVKPAHAEAVRRGLDLHQVRGRADVRSARFVPPVVVTTPEPSVLATCRQVWLGVPSDALAAAWIVPLGAAAPLAAIVSPTPALEDGARLRAWLPNHRHVDGVVGFVAWQSPLPGEAPPGEALPRQALPPGIAYWFPPLSASFFDGGAEAADEARAIVATLRRGGCPAACRRGAAGLGAQASALMLPVLMALEQERWSLRDLLHGWRVAPAMSAAREALSVADEAQGSRSAWLRFVARAPLVRLALSIAPSVTPFPLEAYLRYHFTKVGSQTRAMLAEYVRRGRATGRPTTSLEQLLRAGERSS